MYHFHCPHHWHKHQHIKLRQRKHNVGLVSPAQETHPDQDQGGFALALPHPTYPSDDLHDVHFLCQFVASFRVSLASVPNLDEMAAIKSQSSNC